MNIIAEFAHDCPNCRAQKASFTVYEGIPLDLDNRIIVSLGICGVCKNGVVIYWEHSNIAADPLAAILRIVLHYSEEDLPGKTPEPIAGAYREAYDSLCRGNWNAAGMTFRRTLELATRKLDESLAKKKLNDRIDALAASGTITADLKDWAHEIRLGGNDAAHEDDPITEDDARDLHVFTRNFLTYTFTLPGYMEDRRQRRQQGNAGQTTP